MRDQRLIRLLALILAGTLLGACPSADNDDGAPDAGRSGERNCTDTYDNDADGRVDCLDIDCSDDTACWEDCFNGLDDDNNGLIDCADAHDCKASRCPEVCNNDYDDNVNGVADCQDLACRDMPECTETDAECNDGIDNDGDNQTDCQDRSCDHTAPCGDDCDNGLDDDNDGMIDCRDSDCTGTAECTEDCDNGLDDDGDGKADCADTYSCMNNAACPENCTNGLDDDSDGEIDCADDYGTNQCVADPVCHEAGAECGDSIDNDGDGRADCADYECSNTPPCAELCDNNVDDDNDGKVDCADGGYSCGWFTGCNPIDCQEHPACEETGAECTDGLDNDEDGKTDCQDTECDLHASCPENCSNGVDDDADTRVDCADARCSTFAGCIESGNCTDNVDNDLDGLVDCRDTSSCSTMEPCRESTHCDDRLDNDFDGFTDCAESGSCDTAPTCTAAGGCTAAVTATPGTVQGNTTFGSHGHTAACETSTAGEPEDVYRFVPTQNGVLFAHLQAGDDMVLYARTACTATTELACVDNEGLSGDPELLRVDVTNGVPMFVFVDGGFFADGYGLPYSVTFSFATMVTETESNDFTSSADPFTAPFIGVLGKSDRDFVSVTVNVLTALVAETADLGDGTCNSGGLDTRVTIYSSNGTSVVATDEDSGAGTCSRATATVLPGTYFILVERRGQTVQRPYRLLVNGQ